MVIIIMNDWNLSKLKEETTVKAVGRIDHMSNICFSYVKDMFNIW